MKMAGKRGLFFNEEARGAAGTGTRFPASINSEFPYHSSTLTAV